MAPTALLPVARNRTFRHDRTPLRRSSTVRLDEHNVQGPVPFLNPTRARFNQVEPSLPEDQELQPPPRVASIPREASITPLDERPTGFRPPQPTLTYQWTSRNSRKGRQTLLIPSKTEEHDDDVAAPEPTSSFRHVLHTIRLMFTSFPIGDISFDVAFLFTVGSAVWILNGFFNILPYTNPSSEFPGMVLYGGGITAFVGALIFEIGGILMFLEAVNEDRVEDFGWAVEQLYDHHPPPANRGESGIPHRPISRQTTSIVPKPTHHRPSHIKTLTAALMDTNAPNQHTWTWFPTPTALTTHYVHSLGFLACSLLALSITVFCIACVAALPPFYQALDTRAKLVAVYWAPQVVGGVGFVVAGAMFTLETQECWWVPAWEVLGWWIGVWNVVGGVVSSWVDGVFLRMVW